MGGYTEPCSAQPRFHVHAGFLRGGRPLVQHDFRVGLNELFVSMRFSSHYRRDSFCAGIHFAQQIVLPLFCKKTCFWTEGRGVICFMCVLHCKLSVRLAPDTHSGGKPSKLLKDLIPWRTTSQRPSLPLKRVDLVYFVSIIGQIFIRKPESLSNCVLRY